MATRLSRTVAGTPAPKLVRTPGRPARCTTGAPPASRPLEGVAGQVDLHQVEPRLVAQGLEVRILLLAGAGAGERVGAAHPPPVGHQGLAQGRADEPRAPGHDRAGPRRPGRRVRPAHGGPWQTRGSRSRA